MRKGFCPFEGFARGSKVHFRFASTCVPGGS